jgi:hypothetical protein
MGDVMQLRRLRRFVLRVGISNCCLFRRILWTARTLHEAFEAISLVLNPSFSNVSIKICCATSSCGAMIVADTRALTPACWKKRKNARSEGRQMTIGGGTFGVQPGQGCTATKCLEMY